MSTLTLVTATLTYRRHVNPAALAHLPARLDSDDCLVETAKTVFAMMSNASGGHILRLCQVSAIPGFVNMTSLGCHVVYRDVAVAHADLADLLALRVTHRLGDVITDRYEGGWRRPRWVNTPAGNDLA